MNVPLLDLKRQYHTIKDEINEVIAQGQGTPAQPSPPPDSPLYHEKLATQYTEYDVDLANEYLDKVLARIPLYRPPAWSPSS